MENIKETNQKILLVIFVFVASCSNLFALENINEELQIFNFLSGSWDTQKTKNTMKIPFSWGAATVNTMGTVVFDFGREPIPILHIGEVGNFEIQNVIIDYVDKIVELTLYKDSYGIDHIKLHYNNPFSIRFEEISLLGERDDNNEYMKLSGPDFEYDEDILKNINIEIIKHFGVLNDSRVRVRNEPNLDGEHLGYLEKNQKVEVISKTNEIMKIGDMNSVWYKIKTIDGVEGWAYGFFIDLEPVTSHSDSK